jgi:hypothetical protein
VDDRALVHHVEGHRGPGRDLDVPGDDGHLLEHDLERLRRPERGLGGGRGGGRPTGLDLLDPAPDLAELHHHDQQGEEHHPDDEAEHDLLEAEGGLLGSVVAR